MLTPDQIRLGLSKARLAHSNGSGDGVRMLVEVLIDVLPGLLEENERLRRDLKLSQLSRGVPVSVGRD